MDKKSKSISGLSEAEIIHKVGKYFTEKERRKVIDDYLSSDCTKREIWKKYTGQEEEHGYILRWMRFFGIKDKKPSRNSTFASNIPQMKNSDSTEILAQSFEILQLKKRIEELEKQLKDAEMKSIAFSTMIDLAETELKIKIRKKYNSKPSNK